MYNKKVLHDFKEKIKLDISNCIQFASGFYEESELRSLVDSIFKNLKYE